MTKHGNLRPQTVLGHPVVLFIPLIPHFPLVAAHPTEHQRDSLLVGEFDDAFAGNFRLPAKHIQSEILYITQDGCFAVWVISIQKIGRVNPAAHQEILTIDLEVEISTLSYGRELFIVIAILGDRANAKPDVSNVGDLIVLENFQVKVIETWAPHSVRPP